MRDEEWKVIKGFDNYEVSNLGAVRNLDTGRDISQIVHPSGVLKVSLWRNNLRKTVYVHQLVAEAFHSWYIWGMHVTHSNGVKYDNRACNLQPRSFAESERHGYIPTPVRGRNVKIVETGQIFLNAYVCARYIGGYATNIYACLKGRRKSYLGFTFEVHESEVDHYEY